MSRYQHTVYEDQAKAINQKQHSQQALILSKIPAVTAASASAFPPAQNKDHHQTDTSDVNKAVSSKANVRYCKANAGSN